MERFVPWDVLSLGTFCPWDVLSWDVLSWDVLYVHRTNFLKVLSLRDFSFVVAKSAIKKILSGVTGVVDVFCDSRT